ncbi:bifunctional diguanylate cyclase/phosphodiesterase [Aliikangiella coralliicola]|uniref:EAL domain-containing protein n=1 Tax=Aliikangiella coralliicola TaxID=2592383 RepID=A0A545UJM3_9GAMM|nr:EAL domain-containing protein [Aliikangiella coralliicola]TQV89661.1 EAL domain-containing protein [Aliikangiella coralliicola]
MKNETTLTEKDLCEEIKDLKVRNAELEKAARRFTAAKKLQNALFRIVDIANSTADLYEFYCELHNIVSELTSAKNFFIALYHQDVNGLSFPYYEDDEDNEQGKDEPLHNKEKIHSAEKYQASPTMQVITQGKLLHLNAQQIAQMGGKGRNAEDWIGVPLIQGDKVLGALVVQSYAPGFSYSKRDENLLTYVSQHIATGLSRKQSAEALKDAHKKLQQNNLELENRVQERTNELNQINLMLANEVKVRRTSEKIQKALFKITDLVSTATSLNDLFEGVHRTISELMYAENAFIAIVSKDKDALEFPYFADQHDARPGIIQLDSENDSEPSSLTVKVFQTGEPILFERSKDKKREVLGPEPISWLGVPLKDQAATFGVIVVQSYDKNHIHSNQNLSVLITIAKQVATAILRKKDADALKQAHENLERRVKERTSVLEKTIVKRRKIEKQLEHESLHDALTQLPNRKYLTEQLKIVLEGELTESSCDIALLFLDLDRFKIINDSLGHHIGDLFLVEVAKRLTSCMRDNDVVVRLGGDEFCILMSDVRSEKVAIRLAERVLNQLRSPVEVEQHSLITSASIGVRLAKVGKDNAVQVIGDADSAMYQAKHDGKNRYCLFDANIKKIVSKRLQLEQDLRNAIGTDQLSLYYQPILELFTNSIVGLEALIRWEHPTEGFISPVEFIPIAEETGLIQEVGEKVVEMACQSLHEFSQISATESLYVNVNISAIQILSRTSDESIRKLIAKYKIDPSKLNAEITESILVEDFKAAIQFVQELKTIGMKVFLDDFGTGYSSLSYLHQFPFDLIKLDQSFIQSTSENNSNITLIESIGFLATNLGMDIVVEGIETEAQMMLAQNLNCRFGQGYLFAKPMPKHQLIKFVQEYATSTSFIN